MNDREKYIIHSFEKMNNEYIKLEKKDRGLKTKIKKICKLKDIKKIKKIIREKNITIRCKLHNLKNTATEENNMKYEPYEGEKKIVIYTCITGGYDNLLEPYYWDEKCDYVVFTDSKIESEIYKVVDIPEKVKELNNNTLINRYMKLHPHELFEKEYDYAIYIDGNVRPISNLSSFVNKIDEDIGISMHKHSIRDCIYDEAKILKIYKKGNYEFVKQQIEKYKEEGFPEKFGMVEAGVIITDLKNNNAKEILKKWWEEFLENKSMRDQLSLPYILWKNKIDVRKISTLGNNVFKNPKIKVIRHI